VARPKTFELLTPDRRFIDSRVQDPTPLPAAATGGFFLGPGVSIFNFNGLVHCVSADRAPTCLVADRRKTKPSDREARAGLGAAFKRRSPDQRVAARFD
jgi:hypothetical protein